MWRDFRFSTHQWKRNKGYAALIIFILGVGIGANTLIFSFIEAVMLKPLPVRDPQNLFLARKFFLGNHSLSVPFYYSTFEKIQARKDLFSSAIAEEKWTTSSFVPLDAGGRVGLVSTQVVSPNYFSDLGIHAILGRVLLPSDAKATSIPVVISYQFWRSQFDGSRNVLGRKLRLKKYPFRIVGVLPRDFHDINNVSWTPDVRLPISAAAILTGHSVFAPYLLPYTNPMLFEIDVRLAPHVAAASAGSALTRLAQASETATISFIYSEHHWPVVSSWIQSFLGYRVALQAIPRGISPLRGRFSSALYALMGAVGLLLLAACANVSGLLLARGERRRQEIAVRVALGASRGQLMRQFFMENLFLAIPAAGLGILLAYLASPVLLHLVPPVRAIGMGMYPEHEILAVPLDPLALGFTIAAALLSIFLFGLGPAWRETRAGLTADLSGSRQSRRKTFSGIWVVAIQVGLSVILVAGAVLMVRTFWALEHVNPGFDYTRTVAVELSPKLAGYSGKQASAFLNEVKTEVAAIPGVRSDAYALQELMQGVAHKQVVVHRGEVLPKAVFDTLYNAVSPGYFRTMGIPLLLGRTIETGDGSRKITPVVVNKAFADHFFPRQNPLGKEMIAGTNGKQPPNLVIVGVVGTANYQSMRQTHPRILYHPLDAPFGQRAEERGIVLCVRSFGEPEAIIHEVRSAIHRIDPKAPIIGVSTLKQEALSTLWKARLMMLLAGFFGIVSLVLAGAGIYGALAYSVASRTREIGIRMAVGAQRKDVLRSVCRRMSIAVGCGLLFGIVAAAFLLRLAQSFLFGVQAVDPLAFSAAILALLLGSVLGAIIPVLRAIRTDPAQALRTE